MATIAAGRLRFGLPEKVARKRKAATLGLLILQTLVLAVLLADVNSERRRTAGSLSCYQVARIDTAGIPCAV